MTTIEETVCKLADTLRGALSDLPNVTVHDLGMKKCAIVTFEKQGETPTDMAARLRQRGINVSVIDTLSAQLDFSERGLDQLVRASVHYFNTEEEVERVVAAVKD